MSINRVYKIYIYIYSRVSLFFCLPSSRTRWKLGNSAGYTPGPGVLFSAADLCTRRRSEATLTSPRADSRGISSEAETDSKPGGKLGAVFGAVFVLYSRRAHRSTPLHDSTSRGNRAPAVQNRDEA